jgi:hypothetical protein
MEAATALRKPTATSIVNDPKPMSNSVHGRTLSKPSNAMQSRLGSSVARSNPNGPYTRPASMQSHYASSGYGHSRAKSQSVAPKQLATAEMPPPRQNGRKPFTLSTQSTVSNSAAHQGICHKMYMAKTLSSRPAPACRSVSSPVDYHVMSESSVRSSASGERLHQMSQLQVQTSHYVDESHYKIPNISSSPRDISSSHSSAKSQLMVTTPQRAPSPTKPTVRSKSSKKMASCSPRKPNFLSKDSNLTNPTDWNGTAIENRLAAMEGLYDVMKSQMEGTTFERSSMKELMEQMRARSK